MSEILVTGATGNLGSAIVPVLLERGHVVRAMSRQPGEGRVVADLATGAGLPDALRGADVVIHAAKHLGSGWESHDADYTTRLAQAAATAGVGHLIYVSIVGVDRNPFRFYATKLECERIVARCGVPYSIIRAAQFPDLVLATLRRGIRGPVSLVPAGWSAQPVDVRDVAAHLADRVEAGAGAGATEFVGPQRWGSRQLAREWLRATGQRKLIVPIPIRGPVARAFRMQSNIGSPDAPRGQIGWTQWLREHPQGTDLVPPSHHAG